MSAEFHKLQGGFEPNFGETLSDKGVLATAVCAISNDHGQFLSVYSNRADRISGLPTFTLGHDLNTEIAIGRLHNRYPDLKPTVISVPKLVNEISISKVPSMDFIDTKYEQVRKRAYIPFIGMIATKKQVLGYHSRNQHTELIFSEIDTIIHGIETDEKAIERFGKGFNDDYSEVVSTILKRIKINIDN